MDQELVEPIPQIRFSQDYEVIQALAPDTLHEPFRHRILLGRSHSDRLHLDPLACQDGIEFLNELAVVIALQRHCLAAGTHLSLSQEMDGSSRDFISV
jgi:hypothetical protein